MDEYFELGIQMQHKSGINDNRSTMSYGEVSDSPCLKRQDTGMPCEHAGQSKTIEPCHSICNARFGKPESILWYEYHRKKGSMSNKEYAKKLLDRYNKKQKTKKVTGLKKCKMPWCKNTVKNIDRISYCGSCGNLVRNRAERYLKANGVSAPIEHLHAEKSTDFNRHKKH